MTSREVPGAPRPTKLAPAVEPVSTSTARTTIPAASRRSERVAHGGDLRVGEDHARRERAVGDERHVPAEDRVGGEPALVLAHVREQRAAVRVADRVEPVVPGRAQIRADLDRLARLEPDRLEPEALGVRLPADGDEQLGAASAVEPSSIVTVTSPSRATETARQFVRTSTPASRSAASTSAEANGSSRTITRGAPSSRTTFVPSDVHACASSTPTTPPPRITRRLRRRLRGRRLAVPPRLRLDEARDRRHDGPAPGRDDDRLRGDEHVLADRDAPLAVELRVRRARARHRAPPATAR